tara:strand:- start:1313 stop:1441 length:129 start_codon:yes stop_codon:yes gene_type:complete
MFIDIGFYCDLPHFIRLPIDQAISAHNYSDLEKLHYTCGSFF